MTKHKYCVIIRVILRGIDQMKALERVWYYMKLLIAGSRSIKEFDITPYIPKGTDHIISGGAAGIDTLAEKYADEHRLSKTVLRPKYSVYKKGAPLKRNKEMIEMADYILAVWDGSSHGTKQTIDYAMKLGKKIKVLEITNEK